MKMLQRQRETAGGRNIIEPFKSPVEIKQGSFSLVVWMEVGRRVGNRRPGEDGAKGGSSD